MKTSELTKVFKLGLLPSLLCIVNTCKGAEVNTFAVNPYASLPVSPPTGVKENSLHTSGVVIAERSIPCVLSSCSNPEIGNTVVNLIAIDMVDLKPIPDIAIDQDPCYSVRPFCDAINVGANVTAPINRTNDITSESTVPAFAGLIAFEVASRPFGLPCNDAGFGVVVEALGKELFGMSHNANIRLR